MPYRGEELYVGATILFVIILCACIGRLFAKANKRAKNRAKYSTYGLFSFQDAFPPDADGDLTPVAKARMWEIAAMDLRVCVRNNICPCCGSALELYDDSEVSFKYCTLCKKTTGRNVR